MSEKQTEGHAERAPAVVPLPGGRDLGRALQIYVAGRNRFWTADEKREAAERRTTGGRISERNRIEARETPRTGVPIPDTLEFHRAAGIWRDDLPGNG